MSLGAGLSMYVVVVQKFTFAISSPDEFLSHGYSATLAAKLIIKLDLTCFRWPVL